MTNIEYIKALKKVRIAYIILLFSINIGTIDLLPNWISYILIYQSLNTIGKEENSAYLIKKITISLIIYNVLVWILNMFGMNHNIYLLNILFSILSLFVNYQIMTNIIDISIKHNSKYTNKLKRVRDILTIMFTISTFLFDYVKNDIMSSIYIIFIMIDLILSIKQIYDLTIYINEEKTRV